MGGGGTNIPLPPPPNQKSGGHMPPLPPPPPPPRFLRQCIYIYIYIYTVKVGADRQPANKMIQPIISPERTSTLEIISITAIHLMIFGNWVGFCGEKRYQTESRPPPLPSPSELKAGGGGGWGGCYINTR